MANKNGKEKKTFKDIRDKYIDAREEQREKIMAYLVKQGYHVRSRGGMGSSSYGKAKKKGNKNRIDPPHDLTIWKWIEAIDDENYYFISLQPFDRDPSGKKSYHALMDHIGIFVGKRIDGERIEPKNFDNEKDYREHVDAICKKNADDYEILLPIMMKPASVALPVFDPGDLNDPDWPDDKDEQPFHNLDTLESELEKYRLETEDYHITTKQEVNLFNIQKRIIENAEKEFKKLASLLNSSSEAEK